MRHYRPDSTETEDETAPRKTTAPRSQGTAREALRTSVTAGGANRARARPRRKAGRPSRRPCGGLALLVLVIAAIAFFAGYLPRQRLEATVTAETSTQELALPRVSSRQWSRPKAAISSCCPAIFSRPPKLRFWPALRATSRIATSTSAIASRPGQLLAEIEAPELDQQVEQAKPRCYRPRPRSTRHGQLRSG